MAQLHAKRLVELLEPSISQSCSNPRPSSTTVQELDQTVLIMSMPKRIYLVSKTMDPLLGIFSGIWAYYVYESRLERPSEHSLPSLLRWKMGEIKQRRNATAGAGDVDEQGWKELDEEVRKLQATQTGTEKR